MEVISVEPPRGKGKGKGAPKGKKFSFEPYCRALAAGTFGGIAAITGHEHWFLDETEERMVADPVLIYLETLPDRTLDTIRLNFWPVLLLIIFLSVILPRVMATVKLNASNRYPVRPKGTPPTLRVVAPEGAPTGGGQGGFTGNGAGGWADVATDPISTLGAAGAFGDGQ